MHLKNNTTDTLENPDNKKTLSDEDIDILWRHLLALSLKTHMRFVNISGNFIQLVEAYFSSKHTTSFYAVKLKISESYLRKICQKEFGISPKQCIEMRIILEAISMLKGENNSIKEVSYCLGFEYPAHFTKFFKTYIGFSPLSYRKKSLIISN